MRKITFAEQAKALNLSENEAVQALQDLYKEEYVITDYSNRLFVIFSDSEILRISADLAFKKNPLIDLGKHLDLDNYQIRLLLVKMMEDGKIHGAIIEDPAPEFVPYMVINGERKVVEETIEKLTKRLINKEISEEAFVLATKPLEKKLHSLNTLSAPPQPQGMTPVETEATIQHKGYKEKQMNTKLIAAAVVVVAVIAIIAVSAYWYSTPKTATFTIRIESNTDWTGQIGTVEEGTRSVSGSGTRSYTVTGTIASAVVQNENDYGTLRVIILIGGSVEASQQTTAPYGVVSVSARG